MTNKTVKDAAEHFGGVWPADNNGKDAIAIGELLHTECEIEDENDNEIKIYKGDLAALWQNFNSVIFLPICTKQQFEDYVRGQKMEKQKYKYVDAGIKTVGELFQVLILDEIQVFHNENQVTINGFADVYCSDFGTDRLKINRIDAMLPALTTRQPLPWYEVDGVFPCLVSITPPNVDGAYEPFVRIANSIGNDFGAFKIRTHGGDFYPPECCTPLSPEQAAKYGVE